MVDTRTPGKREYALITIQDAAGGGSLVTLRLETSAAQETPEEGSVAVFSVHHTRSDSAAHAAGAGSVDAPRAGGGARRD